MISAKKVLAALAIAAAALMPTAAPAAPGHGYFVVSDYTLDANILAGPFTYDGCQYVLLVRNFKDPAHCEVKVW